VKDSEFGDWLRHVFDHPVTDPEWYWEPGAPTMTLAPPDGTEALARLLEGAGELLEGLPDDRAAQGFWYVLSVADSFQALRDGRLPQKDRLRVVNAMEPLFRDCFAPRCAPVLAHLGEPGAKPLNEVCFSWWDVLPFSEKFWDPEEVRFFGKAVLAVLERILKLPHDAVREGALHGLALWHGAHPEEVRGIIRRFVDATPGLRAELLDYAAGAAQGETG
jgi:hypothetical protein